MKHCKDRQTGGYGRRRVEEITCALICLALSMLSASCQKESVTLDNGNNSSRRASAAPIDAGPIIERYRALESKRDSTTRLRVSISGSNDGANRETGREIQLNIYRKYRPDGHRYMLIEFTVPPEERDRDGLITIFPDGQIEGVRYIQSTDSFAATRDLMSEDSLLGMTLQELADGQPQKYDFTIVGEETIEGVACYRAEGKLKPGADSKFTRVELLISKETSVLMRAKFYDKREVLVRDLVINRTEQVDGQWTRLSWTIDNVERNKKIAFEATDVKYDQNLKDSLFTREHLKRITSR